MKFDKERLTLYAVTDRRWLDGAALETQVEKALRGGVSLVQLREKKLDNNSFLEEALILKELCRTYQVPLIINDNIDITIKSDSDGIHVGQDDIGVVELRKLLGSEKIIGVSAQTVDQAIKAEKEGADYLGVGTVFSTHSKDDAIEVNYETLKAITSAVSIPVVAIGGINNDNIKDLKGSGVNGIAVISSLFAQRNIKEAAEELREKVLEIV